MLGKIQARAFRRKTLPIIDKFYQVLHLRDKKKEP